MMFRPRVIPVLLLKKGALVKSRKFRNHTYIGDPVNAIKIFSSLKADELILLDIMASRENRIISLDHLRDISIEANMPFAVGGGIRSLESIRSIINAGVEKVVIGAYASINPDFIRQAADSFGSSAIVVCMDILKNRSGRLETRILNGRKSTGSCPAEFAGLMEAKGAGELIIQSIEKDGMRNGYDLPLIKSITQQVKIPVVALGGAGSLHDLRTAYADTNANGLGAGSIFVYKGFQNGVLLNYPMRPEFIFQDIFLV